MSTALQQARPGALNPLELQWGMTRDQIDLIKRTVAKGTSDDELALFLTTAQRIGLDPLARQIYAVMRFDKRENRKVMTIQIAIDGYRAVAQRSGDSDGQEGPWWCGPDRVWHDVWVAEEPPTACKVHVWKKGMSRPFVGVATYLSYVQCVDGKPNSMWERGSDFMLAKCAEAVALRKAHPFELSGTTIPEELGDNAIEAEFRTVDTATPVVQPRSLPAPSKPTIQPATPNTERAEPATVPAHQVERKASEDTAREEALAKARANAAELERAKAAAPTVPATPPAETSTVGLTDEEIDNFAADLYKAPHLGGLKTVALAISKSKATAEQRKHLEKIYSACESKFKNLAAKGAA